MGRWLPDARGRLMQAALDLFTEQGFEETTALQIAERAGVTERTFFRYFPDKREVFFDGSAELKRRLLAAIDEAPAGPSPVDLVVAAFASAVEVIDSLEFARVRMGVILANASLRERELLKMADLAAGATAALRARGASPLEAGIAAETGTTVFKLGFDRWIAGDGTVSLPAALHETYAALRGALAPAGAL